MSQSVNAATSSTGTKRSYRKGNPLSASEKQQAAVARKRLTHKEVKIFVRNPIKDKLLAECERQGVTQAEYIERLLQQAFECSNR
ncbi:replication regulatory protein RepA [Rahnella perminowiae]|uniref:replication regulatory protein RepA n=1 Tax=Rahnella perminowiae TaxID=2816244 RepID=UPI00215CC8B7|nr:replication regulatory protein RepA [Rahnella perminowiae]MCR8998671.1 replication regulatory protein RepA [Rahnella perminowiae]MCR8998729.1 replication regulatory protein RepA [Rahnella perminowiae]